MIPHGTFLCAICEELRNVSRRNKRYASYLPERRISVCDDCVEEWRNDPKHEHLRPDVSAKKRREIEEEREFNREKRIYF